MIARRIVFAAASLAAATLVVTGCAGSSGDDAAADAGPVEISVLVNITPNLTEEWWNELVKPFEDANPDIDVKIMAPPMEGVAASLRQLLAAGTPPDVTEYLPSVDLAPELVDLSEYDWVREAPMADAVAIDGKYLAAGVGLQLQSLVFYNKQAFTEAGITEVPTTIEELETDMQKLQDAGWVPIQSGGEWMTKLGLEQFGLPTVIGSDRDWYAGMTDGSLTYSETYGDTVRRYEEWVKKGFIPADQVGVTYAEAEQSFLAGKAAMYPMGSWFVAAAANAENAPEIGAFLAPAEEGVKDKATAGGLASPYMVMKASKHQDAAIKLVEYLTTDEDAVLAQLEVDGNYRPGFEYDAGELGAELMAIVNETPSDSIVPAGDGFGGNTVPAGYAGELNVQAQAILTGTSAADVLKAMDAWFDANRP